VKALIEKFSLWVRKLQKEKFRHVFWFEGIVEENYVKAGDTGIGKCIKDYWVICSPCFLSIYQKH
jgi:hypothetical protein